MKWQTPGGWQVEQIELSAIGSQGSDLRGPASPEGESLRVTHLGYVVGYVRKDEVQDGNVVAALARFIPGDELEQLREVSK